MDKTLKAELWDKMQYMFRNYYDRMVHCVHYYDGKLDVKTLKQVLVWTVEKVPVLHSAFHGNLVEPYWSVEEKRRKRHFRLVQFVCPIWK